MNQALSTFGLTKEQLQILFDLELYIVDRDRKTKESFLNRINPMVPYHNNKLLWENKYKKNIENFLKEQDPKDDNNSISLAVRVVQQRIKEVRSKTDTDMWKYLVLLECVLFTPYFPMSEEEAEKKAYKGLALDKKTREESLLIIASWLGIDRSFVEKFEKGYIEIIRKLNGYWNKIFLGVGAGVIAAVLAVATAGSSIAALFAAEGLYGAAAISSGLAALGGGAVAAGGFGIVGGWAVLVGGGALLGIGAGGTAGLAVASTSPNAIMTESAKMWVVLKEIVMGVFNDTKRAQDIISSVTDKIAEMKKEITTLKLQQESDKKRIKNLEKSVGYLEKMLNS